MTNNTTKKKFSNANSDDRPRNKVFTFHILECVRNHAGKEYNHQDVENMLCDISDANTFSCVSVPVWLNKSDCSDDKSRKGKLVVGYIKEINNGTVMATIYGNYVQYVDALKDPVIYLRGFVDNNGVMQSVQTFEVCDATRYIEFTTSDSEAE